jgi:hypothetical protein
VRIADPHVQRVVLLPSVCTMAVHALLLNERALAVHAPLLIVHA